MTVSREGRARKKRLSFSRIVAFCWLAACCSTVQVVDVVGGADEVDDAVLGTTCLNERRCLRRSPLSNSCGPAAECTLSKDTRI